MEITELAVKLIILFIPGILATLIINSLIERRSFSNRTFFISSLLLGFLSYFTYFLVINLGHNLYKLIRLGIKSFDFKIIEIDFSKNLLSDSNNVNISECIFAVFISILLAFSIAKMINNAILYKMAGSNKLKVSYKFAEEDVWSHLFYNSNKGLKNKAIVRDIKNNLCYKGAVDCHSIDSSHKELLLYNVGVYKNNKTKKPIYEMSKIYFNFSNDKDLIIEIDSEEI